MEGEIDGVGGEYSVGAELPALAGEVHGGVGGVEGICHNEVKLGAVVEGEAEEFSGLGNCERGGLGAELVPDAVEIGGGG